MRCVCRDLEALSTWRSVHLRNQVKISFFGLGFDRNANIALQKLKSISVWCVEAFGMAVLDCVADTHEKHCLLLAATLIFISYAMPLGDICRVPSWTACGRRLYQLSEDIQYFDSAIRTYSSTVFMQDKEHHFNQSESNAPPFLILTPVLSKRTCTNSLMGALSEINQYCSNETCKNL